MKGPGATETALELAECSAWSALDRLLALAPERADEVDDFGMTPLHWACTDTHVPLRVVKRLTEASPLALTRKNKGGLQPLHIAIKAKTKLEVLSALVAAAPEDGRCLFEETPTGETPAELARSLQLAPDKVAFLTQAEEQLRVAGKGPSRPSGRFQALHMLQSLTDDSVSCSSFRSLPPALAAEDVDTRGGIHSMERSWAPNRRSRTSDGFAGGVPLPPRWRLDKRCNICQLKFNYFKTRHHCRACGESVCSTHSNRRLPLHHLGLKTPQRVCILCYDDLRENGTPSAAVVNMYSHGRGLPPPQSEISGALARQESTPLPENRRSHKLSSGRSSISTRPPLRSVNSTISLTATSTSSQRSSFRSPSATSDRFFHTSQQPRRLAARSGDSSDNERPSSELPFDDELLGRPRAWTDVDASDKFLEMQDQVRELEAHAQELALAKARIEDELQAADRVVADSKKERITADAALGELRNNRIIDITRISLDDDDEEDHENRNEGNGMADAVGPDAEDKKNHRRLGDRKDSVQLVEETEVNVALTCNYLGQVFLDRGEFASAALEFRKSVEVDRKDPDVWVNLARALHGAGEFYDAEIAIRRALALSAKSYASLSMLGKILHSKGEHDKAVEVFREALGLMDEDEDSGDDVGSMTVGW
ncbi:hypothetical protein BBJ28_00003124 [Nothophytophthora sp. Chile5]|nr:hypothetical protein BBJ28_00003124 [Nothophytophthora sp. Chile5]